MPLYFWIENLQPCLIENNLVMAKLLLNTLALDPNRWTSEKRPAFRLDVLLPEIAARNFDLLEIWQYHLTSASEQELVEIRLMLNDFGMEVPIVGAYPILHVSGVVVQHEITKFVRVLEIASALNARGIKIFAGNQPTACLNDTQYQNSVGFLRKLVELAEERDLLVFTEAHRKTLFDDPVNSLKVLKEVNLPNLKICYQPYEFNSTERFISDYKLLADHIGLLHFQGRRDKRLVPIEQADIDYALFFDEISNRLDELYLSIELVAASVLDAEEEFSLTTVLDNAAVDRDYLNKLCSNPRNLAQ